MLLLSSRDNRLTKDEINFFADDIAYRARLMQEALEPLLPKIGDDLFSNVLDFNADESGFSLRFSWYSLTDDYEYLRLHYQSDRAGSEDNGVHYHCYGKCDGKEYDLTGRFGDERYNQIIKKYTQRI